jgi:antitoxin (DNA-binding transcriptional repressor) of toxin-antitoxin stability system
MKPTMVGARELKTRLGAYLRRVREGERIVVSERGTPVAELRALRPDDEGIEARLVRLEAAGLLSQPTRALAPLRAIESRGASASEAVIEGREDRF